jgi:hypothetical protein
MKVFSLLLLAIIGFTFEAAGFTTRYWDCCKPSCSWPSAGGDHPAKHCDASMNRLNDNDAKSMCEGGPSTACLDQIPMVVNDNLAYAFGAVPGNGPNVCGQCFELTFTGQGKYESRLNHKKLSGKKLIVMASNIGYDVEGGQFDIMIPGGGVGLFNGCASILGNNLGKQYGGLLADCEDEVGYQDDDQTIYEKRKSCLTNKCNSAFAGKGQALQGCLFLANWMEAAGCPSVEYRQVDCPNELKSKY